MVSIIRKYKRLQQELGARDNRHNKSTLEKYQAKFLKLKRIAVEVKNLMDVSNYKF